MALRGSRGLFGIGLVVLTMGATGAVWSEPRPGQTFRAAVTQVHLPVVVTTKDGAAVRGLAAADFEVIDGGTAREIVSFAGGDAEVAEPPAAKVPLHLGVMLDKSESMELDAKVAADAVIRFVEDTPDAEDVTFVAFDSTVRVSRFSSDSYLQLFTRIRERATGTQTALYDAMGRYVATTHERPGQHVLLVYTDGGDSGRGINATNVRDLLREGNVLVYGIVYLENQSPSERARQRAVMTQLTRETGGEAYFPSSARDITDIYERIRGEIASRYTIGYTLPAEAADGRFRRVTVRLRGPGRDDLRVRTRSGYVVSASPR
jgi:VWFA-related protein